MQCLYTLGTSSASHTYGNVASFLREALLDYFPQDFFTHVYVDSKIAWKDINEILGAGDVEFRKRHYPFMIISQKFGNSDQERFLYDIPLTKNMDNVESGLRRNTLFPVIKDVEHGVEISYKINRDRVEFDIELRLRSVMQQLDVYKNLQNQMLWDRPFSKKASLESMIPKSMITYIGKIAGIDLDESSTTSQIPIMMRYLNGHGKHPITYKIRNSTSVEEYFMYYSTNLMMTFTDLQINDGNKKNSVDEYFPLTFHVTTEFNLPGLFALIGTHEGKFNGYRFDAIVSAGDKDQSELIPLYTCTNLYDRYRSDTMDGFQFYTTTIVQSEEKDKHKDETVTMTDMIPEDHMKVLNAYLRDQVPPETLFRFRLLKNSEELPEGEIQPVTEECPAVNFWEIDWKRKSIIIHDSDPLVTYRVIIYANLVQINQRVAMMQDQTKRDQPTL